MNRLVALLLVLALSACRSAAPQSTPRPPAARAQTPIVVLVSIDGWRHDYLDRFKPPTLTRLASRGVRAEGLIPAKNDGDPKVTRGLLR